MCCFNFFFLCFSVLCIYCLCRSVNKVHDEWFADEENARKTVGLLEKLIEIPKEKEVRISVRWLHILLWTYDCNIFTSLSSICRRFSLTVDGFFWLVAAGLWNMFWHLPSWENECCCMWPSFLSCLLERLVIVYLISLFLVRILPVYVHRDLFGIIIQH